MEPARDCEIYDHPAKHREIKVLHFKSDICHLAKSELTRYYIRGGSYDRLYIDQ